MLVELCDGNYATSDDFVIRVDDIFKASTSYCEKITIQIMPQKLKNWNINKKNI